MSMPFLEGEPVVTLVPGIGKVPENLTLFRWNMQIALPYPFPMRACVRRDVIVCGKQFFFEIHNHFDRVFHTIRSPDTGATWIRSFMQDKRYPTSQSPPNCIATSRQPLQSVVFFDGQTDYPSASEAMSGAGPLMQACMEYLASFLAACQRDAPYLASWLIYPVSLFDVGAVHCEVKGFCTKHNEWHLLESGVQSSLGRQLQQPAFFMNVPDSTEAGSLLDTANELLAEALMASYRGMPRLTVINSYTALESFANAVFSKLQTAQLISNNVSKEFAEEVVEGHRTRHRNDSSFLYHSGIKIASGRSLMEDNKQQYDAVLKLQQLRHRVAHTGYKPSLDEARDAHKLCCETVQWFSAVAGFPVKPLRPAPEDLSQGIVAGLGFICGNPPNTMTIRSSEAR